MSDGPIPLQSSTAQTLGTRKTAFVKCMPAAHTGSATAPPCLTSAATASTSWAPRCSAARGMARGIVPAPSASVSRRHLLQVTAVQTDGVAHVQEHSSSVVCACYITVTVTQAAPWAPVGLLPHQLMHCLSSGPETYSPSSLVRYYPLQPLGVPSFTPGCLAQHCLPPYPFLAFPEKQHMTPLSFEGLKRNATDPGGGMRSLLNNNFFKSGKIDIHLLFLIFGEKVSVFHHQV